MLDFVTEMGLDTVELVIRIEETFGVSIPDERAGQIETVGDLYDFLLEETAPDNPRRRVCLSAVTFYRLRRVIRRRFGVEARFHPRHHVSDVLPRMERRSTWRTLEEELQLQLPDLSRPAWMVWSLAGLLVLFGCWIGVVLYNSLHPVIAGLGATGCVIVSGMIAARLTVPFATLPGSRIATFGALTNRVVASNYARLSEEYGTSSPEEISRMLRFIVVDQLGVKPEDVTREAHIVKDLGAN